MDNALAVDQMEVAYSTLLNRPIISKDDQTISFTRGMAKDGQEHPRIVR
jgi:agmatinase